MEGKYLVSHRSGLWMERLQHTHTHMQRESWRVNRWWREDDLIVGRGSSVIPQPRGEVDIPWLKRTEKKAADFLKIISRIHIFYWCLIVYHKNISLSRSSRYTWLVLLPHEWNLKIAYNLWGKGGGGWSFAWSNITVNATPVVGDNFSSVMELV